MARLTLPDTTKKAPESPFTLFEQWYDTARREDPEHYNAVNLATVKKDGTPDSRMVLLKGYDEKGFVFYTNRESEKGRDIEENPCAALCFYWKELGGQIRIRGTVEKVSDAESDAYFQTRPHGSKIGAWASQQSRPLKNMAELLGQAGKYESRYFGKKTIPRPPYWGGYRVIPERIEFWKAGTFRLHTRIVYGKTENGWDKTLLYP